MEEPKSAHKTTTARFNNKHTDDLVDHYWGSINYLTGLIKASELKAGLILSFYGILLNFIYQSSSEISNSIARNYVLYGLIGLWVVLTAASIFFCVRCFIPKIEGNYEKNMFFFKDIISKFGTVNEFSKSFFEMSTDENQLFKQLGEQIFIISKIADWKFKNVKRAISLLAVGLGVLFLIGIYHVFMAFF
jgi:hypothetical protein